jgi:hypothetical protein
MDIKTGGVNPVVVPIEYVQTPEGTTGKGEAVWSINVPEDGVYELWAKVRANGASVSGSDSFKVQINSTSEIDWPFSQDSNRPWRWGKITNNGQPYSFNLTAGTNLIKFKTRETGAQLASAFLTKDLAAAQPFTSQSVNGIFLPAANAQVVAPMQFYPANSAMQVVMDASAPLSYNLGVYQPNDGRWPESFPRLRANCTAVNPRFIAFMMPHYNDAIPPVVTFSDVADGRKISVDWPYRTDEMIWTAEGITVNIGDDRCAFEIAGDVNNDCVVNLDDLAIFAQSWLLCSMPYQSGCSDMR